MSIENPSERFERTEAYLKQRLSDYKDVMPVKWNNGVTLLEIYWEWMNYLVKENLKGRSDLLPKWQKILLERNTDAIADLLIAFFEAKRRYGRDKERGEDKWDWFALCKNYCKKNGWNDDENLLHSLFSSYSGAERRIYRKVEKGKVLADTSKSLLSTIALTKDEMIRKENEKKVKVAEKLKIEEEKQRKKEEIQRKKEEKNRNKSEEKNTEEIPDIMTEWAKNHYAGNDRDVVNEDGDVVPNPKDMHIPTRNWGVFENEENNALKTEKIWKNVDKKLKKWPKQLEIPFEFED